jgi:hemerythrin-like metal-binding protein
MTSPSLTLGIHGFTPIDQAHRALFELLSALTPECCSVECVVRFKRMLDEHFADEEGVMTCCPVPVRIRHIEAHRSFHDAVCELQTNLIRFGRVDRYELDCLTMWFLVHSSTHDAILVQHLRESGGCPPDLPRAFQDGTTVPA